jgi:hypothetical protein
MPTLVFICFSLLRVFPLVTAVDEPQVGGVYVRLFLKDPKFPLRNRKRFLEGLLDQYVATSATVRSGAGDPELPLLFSAALVSLLRVHVSLLSILRNPFWYSLKLLVLPVDLEAA